MAWKPGRNRHRTALEVGNQSGLFGVELISPPHIDPASTWADVSWDEVAKDDGARCRNRRSEAKPTEQSGEKTTTRREVAQLGGVRGRHFASAFM